MRSSQDRGRKMRPVAVHRALLAGSSSARTHLPDTDTCIRWPSWPPTSSASAVSSSASAPHLALPPSSANDRGNRSQRDGTIFVEPKGCDEEAEIGDGLFHQAPATALTGRAAHTAQAAAGAAAPVAPWAVNISLSAQISALCVLLTVTHTLHQPGGSGSTIPSPAGGLRAAGLSFVGLPGLVSALSACPLCRLREAAGSTAAAARAAARAARAAGVMAVACAQPAAPVWPPEQAVAAAHAPARASPAAI